MRSRRTYRAATAAVVGMMLATSAANAQPSFNEGDLYLCSRALAPIPTADPWNEGVVRIDPVTQVATQLPYVPTGSLTGRMAYDPYRDRLIITDTNFFIAIDAAGNGTQITTGAEPVTMPAATGDGRIYFMPGSGWAIGYIDAADTFNDLLNIAGTGPYTQSYYDALFWHGPTNSLFLTHHETPWLAQVNIIKLTLTPDGSQVLTESTASYDVSAAVGEVCMGMSHGPGGTIFIMIDTNSNDLEPRMLTLDPVTMTLEVYANRGGYSGAAAAIAGVYSPVNDRAVVLDTFFDELQEYAQGSLGGVGSPWSTTGVSTATGHSETAQLIVIPPLACPADLNGDGILDNGDIQTFLALFLAGDLGADMNGDGILDNGDIQTFLALFLGGC